MPSNVANQSHTLRCYFTLKIYFTPFRSSIYMLYISSTLLRELIEPTTYFLRFLQTLCEFYIAEKPTHLFITSCKKTVRVLFDELRRAASISFKV